MIDTSHLPEPSDPTGPALERPLHDDDDDLELTDDDFEGGA